MKQLDSHHRNIVFTLALSSAVALTTLAAEAPPAALVDPSTWKKRKNVEDRFGHFPAFK